MHVGPCRQGQVGKPTSSPLCPTSCEMLPPVSFEACVDRVALRHRCSCSMPPPPTSGPTAWSRHWQEGREHDDHGIVTESEKVAVKEGTIEGNKAA
eukprot:3793656-Pleurochrysis_carterae.AAC.1